ncbi:helix-turn-helix transcriptional regulator [Kribbella sp. NPDC048915]|uniref:response regulator transcription factor n=1 Tax=Kribbella sp. NPDC048915 TaxID=3155148 RepID=UPI00340DD675
MAAGRQLTQQELMAEALALPTPTDRPLSSRELEVAELVGQGLGNDQIAETLTISRRTVESHLEHIRIKLDLNSRYEIITWALSKQLTRSG